MKEKRLATILYADLTGFTQLTSQLGPEKVTEFINECFKKIDSIIHIYDGTVVRHEGDRVMAVFGFPKSQGNDSYCAILSALRIKEAVKNLSFPIETHIGIATGEVMCEDNNIYGYVIETASQLEEDAPGAEIYIDSNCYELNKTFFEFEKISKNQKYFYKFLSEKKSQKQYEHQFRNREKECVSLSTFITQQEKAIIVTGEPGIGKTRFICETINRMNNDDRFNFLQTSFLTTRSLQFYESILKIMAELNPSYVPKTDVDLLSESYNVKLYSEFCDNIFTASKIKPLILLFQYFDRVDKNSLEFFKFLINNIEEQNTTLIFEMHKLHGSIFDVLKSVAKFDLKTIELKPLDRETQLGIISDHLIDIDIPKNTVDEIVRHAGGNPLFLSEVCYYIKEQHGVGKVINEIKVPYRIKEAFNHLIDHIPLGIFDTLSIGALYGYSFNKNFMEAASPNCDEAIAHALENGLIEVNKGEITFRNPFFRDEICNRIPKSARQDIHRKIANILRERFAGRDTDKKLAHHFCECGDYELALHYAMKWAKRLKDMHANEMALDAYDNAFAISYKINNKLEFEILVDRVDLLNLLGKREEEKITIDRLEEIIKEKNYSNSEEKFLEVLLRKGRYLESISDFDTAIKLYEDYNRKKKEIRVLERLGMTYYGKSKFSKAVKILNEALDTARKGNNIKKEADLLRNLGLICWKMGDIEKSLEYSEKALELFGTSGDAVSEAHVIANMGNAYLNLNRYDDALECYNKALSVAKEIGDIVFKSRMLTNSGIIYGRFGDHEKSLAYYKEALEIDDRIMNRKGKAIVLNNIGHVYGIVGKFDEALSYFNDALKISEEIGDKTGIAIRLGNIGNCYAHLNQYSEAINYMQKAVDLSIELNLPDYISYYKNELAAIMIDNKRYDDAIRIAQDATHIAIKMKNISYEITGMAYQALAYAQIGETKKALKFSKNAVNQLEKTKTIKGEKSEIYYTYYKILKAINKEKEALEYLEKSYNDVRKRGDQINDENLRKSYFNIKENKEIIEEWEVLRK